jgi:hypothetical protein
MLGICMIILFVLNAIKAIFYQEYMSNVAALLKKRQLIADLFMEVIV